MPLSPRTGNECDEGVRLFAIERWRSRDRSIAKNCPMYRPGGDSTPNLDQRIRWNYRRYSLHSRARSLPHFEIPHFERLPHFERVQEKVPRSTKLYSGTKFAFYFSLSKPN